MVGYAGSVAELTDGMHNPFDGLGELLDAATVAEALNVDTRVVRSLAAEGKLPGAFRLPGKRTHWQFNGQILSNWYAAEMTKSVEQYEAQLGS